uniref:Acyl-CoA-binding domain-containing protein 5 n=1 Tax=Callorhinchus milii TaxID=7868 RepID=A0A4W3GXJ8_CALMI
ATNTQPLHSKYWDVLYHIIKCLLYYIGSFQPSNELMLKFYSYYKQATLGPCNTPRPGFWDPIGKYKWDAWNSLGDMSKEEAMIAYVEEMKTILESMPMTEKVEDLLRVIGPFYELVDDKKQTLSPLAISADLGNVLSSAQNCDKMNGNIESNDSSAESEQEEGEEDDDEDATDDDEKEENEVVKLQNLTQGPAVDMKAELVLPNGTVGEKLIPCAYSTFQNSKSSLNGEETADKKTVLQMGPATDINGEIDGMENHLEDISGIQHITSDSDSEDYCDSMEQLGLEEISKHISDGEMLNSSPKISAVAYSRLSGSTRWNIQPELEHSAGTIELQGEHKGREGGVAHGGEDTKPSGSGSYKEKIATEKTESRGLKRMRGNRMQYLGDSSQVAQQGSSGDGERWNSDWVQNRSLNQQIAAALSRLQEDMQDVVERLHTLEALTVSQANSENLQPNSRSDTFVKKSSWWPFEVSGHTLAFAVLWPFIAQLLVHLYFQRRKRKLN